MTRGSAGAVASEWTMPRLLSLVAAIAFALKCDGASSGRNPDPGASRDASATVDAASVRDVGAARSPEASGKSDGSGDRDAAHPDGGRPRGVPPEVLTHARDWPMPNRDYESTRATFDSTIDASNVSTLVEAWSLPLPPSPYYGSATAAPVVLGGTVYLQDMSSDVLAIDAKTGSVLWQTIRSRDTGGPNGLAIGWGKIFATGSDRTFGAIDLATGAELWTARIPVPQNGGIVIAPIAYDGLVFMSTAPVNSNGGYIGGASGVIYALDERSGDVVWGFDTDESGNLWGNPDVNSGGGAWYPPTLDPERGLTYWGTGNPGPYGGGTDFPAGSTRPGPNLYTDSVVALSLETGALEWFHQERPHDLFDLDFQNSPILVDARIEGGLRRVVIGSGKTGTVVALDAQTGELMWRTPVGRHENDEASAIPDGGLWVYPGFVGGVETPPAYADGVVYVPYNDYGVHYEPVAFSGSSAPSASLAAIDVATGAILWQAHCEGVDGGGATLALGGATVSNDLVFTSTSDGAIYAFRRTDGHEVWRYAAHAGINAPLSIVGDTLYVAAGTAPGSPTFLALRVP